MKSRILATLSSVVVLAACESSMDREAPQSVNVGVAATPGTPEDFQVNLTDRVYFEFNESDLTEEARETLNAQASWLKTYGNTTAIIGGHCDDRGTREFNLALGAQRAAAAKHYLVRHTGISQDRLKTISYGKDQPLVEGSGEAVWSQQRAAVTTIQ